MAMKLYNDTDIEKIAEAIREPQGLIAYNMINISHLYLGFVSAVGTISADASRGERYSDFIKVNPNTTYTFEIYETSSTFDNWIGIGEYSNNNYETFIRRDVMNNVSQKYYTFTTSNTCRYLVVSSRNLAEATQIGLSQGNRTAYEPYCKYKVREMATGINNLADKLKSYIPHTSTSGNPLSINSIPLKPKEIYPVVGDSKQNTTTGKNLFNETYYKTATYTINVYKNTQTDVIGDQKLYFKAKLKEGKTAISGLYFCLCNNPQPNISGSQVAWCVYNGVIIDNSLQYQKNYFDFNSNTPLYISFFPNTINPEEIFETYYLWISTDDVNYEPYTNRSKS